MLKINNLTIITHTGRKLLDSFSFTLNEYDKVALIGEEGNGKSTILKIIASIDVENYATYTGTINCDGKIGYLPQNIEDKYLEYNVIDYISNDIDYNHLYSFLNKIDVDPSLFDQKIKTLSGGEKVKIALLKIMYTMPDVLLLDEPTNDLDIKTLVWLEEFIKNSSIPILFVSHDETLLENCANGILLLEQLKRKSETHISYSGCGYKEFMKRRNAYIVRNNMIAAKEKSEFNKQLQKWRQIYQKVEYQQRNISRQDPHGGQLLKKKMHAVKAMGKKMEEKKTNLTQNYEPEEAIDIFFEKVEINPNKVILDYHLDTLKVEDKILAKNIDLKVLAKHKICIIGENGVGKSTLIKKIWEYLKTRDDIHPFYMPQNYDEVLDYDSTPVDYLWDKKRKEDRGKVQSFLGALKFTSEEMEHKIKELSQGQKCKLLLIKAILDKADVLVLDEPTRNLSPLSNPKIREILCDYQGSIIAISHDRKFVEEVANEVYELSENGITKID